MTPVDLEGEVRTLLDTVRDPEIPVLSIADLGILRDVRVRGSHVEVTITPTYTACPAMAQIEADIGKVLGDAGWHTQVRTQLSPAWTTDWLSAEAREKLRGFGIAAPRPACVVDAAAPPSGERRVIPIHATRTAENASIVIAKNSMKSSATAAFSSEFANEGIPCPLCGSHDTEELARFGSTACKALYRCRACREAFDYFKPY